MESQPQNAGFREIIIPSDIFLDQPFKLEIVIVL